MSAPTETAARPLPVTAQLSQFLAKLRFESLPRAAVDAAKRSLLDWLGCALLGSQQAGTQPLRAVLKAAGGEGSASVLGHPLGLSVLNAALANGQAGHVLDYDSIHLGGVQLHAASPVFAALLALSADYRTSGTSFITAAVAGYEAGVRSGLAAPRHHAGGWHLTGTLGAIAAGAAAAKLLELDARRYCHALGIAATQAAGLQQNRGTLCKSLHAGKAAASGVLAALLAGQGHDSAADILEGDSGFARVYSGEVRLDQSLHELGSRWEITRNSFKPYACGIVLHPAIDAVISLKREHGIPSGKIEAISLRVHPHVLALTGVVNPEAGLKAKFSVGHAAAVAYIDGAAGVRQFSDERAADREVVALRDKVGVETDAALRRDQAQVRLHTGGQVLSRAIEHASGTVDNPMSDAELQAKFIANASAVVGPARTQDIIRRIQALETLDDISPLGELCRT